MEPLPSSVLPAGVRSRILPDINGLDIHILEAGFEPRGRPDPYDDRGGWDHGRGDGGGYGGGGYGGGYDGGGGYGRGPREDVRVRCESRNNRYTSCRIDIGHGRVELVRQFSDDDCSYNRNWGYDRRQIWVDDGCRAEFVIVR